MRLRRQRLFIGSKAHLVVVPAHDRCLWKQAMGIGRLVAGTAGGFLAWWSGDEAPLVQPGSGGLEDATERNANNPGRLFWRVPRSWRLNAAFAGANASAAAVLVAMGRIPGAVVSLVAALAGGVFAWLRWDRQRRLRGRQGRRHPD